MLSAAQHNCVLLVEHPGAPIAGVDAVFKELGQGVVRAASATQALQHARRTDFVLILAGLPGDGAEQLDLLRQLRANPRSSQTPLIVLAPRAGAAFPLEACYEAGAIDVLTDAVAPLILKAKARFFADAARTAAERRRAEEAPRGTSMRLDSTVASAELAMWSWDMIEDRVTGDANMAWLFSLSPKLRLAARSASTMRRCTRMMWRSTRPTSGAPSTAAHRKSRRCACLPPTATTIR